MKKLTAAGLAVTGLLITSTAASAQFFCAPLLIVSGAIVGSQENRELTSKEAMWCGLVRDDEGAKKAAASKKGMKKTAAKKKTPAQ
jgi:hypothetical protein